MKSTAAPRRRQRLPEAERREQILKAAFEVANNEGLDAVTARSVSRAAGLSPGLVFFYFESVDQLQNALVDHVIEQSLAGLATPGPYATLAPAERLPAFLSDRLLLLKERKVKGLIELLVETWVAGLRRAGARDHVRAAAERFRAAILPLAQLAIAGEPARFAGVAPEALAEVVLSILLGTSMQVVVEPRRFDHAATTAALHALLFPGRSSGSSRAQ